MRDGISARSISRRIFAAPQLGHNVPRFPTQPNLFDHPDLLAR
jgi:hypothetical protein